MASWLSTFALLSLNCFPVIGNYFTLPMYDCSSAESHYDFGFCIGSKTAEMAAQRWHQWTEVRNIYEWIKRNSTGEDLYAQFLEKNSDAFKEYIEEIKGISDGSQMEFTKIMIMTCADELAFFSPVLYNPQMSCSDYLTTEWNSKGEIISSLLGHNEDNHGPMSLNHTYIVSANISGEPPFHSYGYAGEALTQSMAWNQWIVLYVGRLFLAKTLVCFKSMLRDVSVFSTANFVNPKSHEIGLCRNLVARKMATMKTLKDALTVSAMDGQSSGHNYQIAEFKTGRSADSEVATNAQHAFTMISKDQQYLFHANEYIHLNIPQFASESSDARQRTAELLGKPKNHSELIEYLSDTSNASYPIYKTGQDADFTLHSVSVDLLNGELIFYADNPAQYNILHRCFNVTDCS